NQSPETRSEEKQRRLRAFVSYPHSAEEQRTDGDDSGGSPAEVAALIELLDQNGLDLFVDSRIAPGVEWDDRLRDELAHSDFVLICLSTAAVAKALWRPQGGGESYFKKEIDAA